MPLEIRAANNQLIHAQVHPDELEIATWLEIVHAVNLLDVLEEAKAALKGLLEYANENNQVSDDLISYAETVLAKLEKPS
mgnify:CR=1 FL=1